MANDFEVGAVVYTPDGRKAEFVSSLPGGGFAVMLAYRRYDDSGEEEEYYDRLGTFPRIFADPPIEVWDASVTKLREQERELREQVAARRNELREVENSAKGIIAKFGRFSALKDLENYLDGKITHFVIVNYGTVTVQEKEATLIQDPERAWNKEQKLLTLFGDTKGDLQWRLNQYRDGSGSSNTECYPCTSLEEARAKAGDIIAADFAGHDPKKYFGHTQATIRSAKALGFPVPDHVQADADRQEVDALRANEATKRAEHEKALAALRAREAA